MNGKEVYKFATREVPRVIEEALEAANMNVDQVDWLLLHQVRHSHSKDGDIFDCF
jgi:3-oxoacyl-[acyl-carrier-protein] synthase-3